MRDPFVENRIPRGVWTRGGSGERQPADLREDGTNGTYGGTICKNAGSVGLAARGSADDLQHRIEFLDEQSGNFGGGLDCGEAGEPA